MTRLITIGWDAPKDGPEPARYEVTRLLKDPSLVWVESRTWWTESTEVTIPDEAREHKYAVRAHNASGGSLPCAAYISFSVTDMEILENGLIVTFATEPLTEYWLEVSGDQGATWHEAGSVTTDRFQHQASIGGNPLVGERKWYRVWKRLP